MSHTTIPVYRPQSLALVAQESSLLWVFAVWANWLRRGSLVDEGFKLRYLG